jgi:hypothetical protein
MMFLVRSVTVLCASVVLWTGAGLWASVVAQAPLSCEMQCNPNFAACTNVTECQGQQRLCIDTCNARLGLPPIGSAGPPAGGYGADALSADGEMLGHAKNWDTRAGAEAGAVKSCEKGGHPGCRPIYSYRNRCVALAWSKSGNMTPKGSWFMASAQVNAAAKSDALKACSASGLRDCFLRSFSCSGQAY